MTKLKDLPEPDLEQEEDDDALIAPPSSTDTTPLRLRSGSISDGRSRSNPRLNRNGMRWDSPLATTPNRLRLEEENRVKRTTIRLNTGSTGIGLSTVRLSSRVVDDRSDRRNKPRSSKQSRPSVRKLRRWDNDNFVGAASELAMAGTPEAADIFLKAQAEKGKFLMANYPLQYRSAFKKLLQDSSLQDVRERFVNGEVADDHISKPLTAKALFNRMNPRLRKIICSSANTDHLHLVDSYESYLQSIFSKTTSTIAPVLSSTLVGAPVIKNESNTTRIIFKFPNNKSAAFSRLLLHAVCDFHNLQSVSSSGAEEHKLLTVSGTYFHYPEYHLSRIIEGKDTSSKLRDVSIALEDSMSLLKVSS